jgi:arachidonate 15-lipoxygenase
MYFWKQEIIETLYRLLKFLATVPLANRWILSNKYEYDYKVLAPLAMTDIPPSRIPGLPALPKKDELPNEKWLSLVLTQISILNKKNKSVIKESVSNGTEIDSLESINEQIKAAEGQEELKNAVLKLKSTLGLGDIDEQREVYSKAENDIQLESNFSEEDQFDKIDKEIQAWLSKSIQEESPTSLKADDVEQVKEVEQVDKELYGHLQKIAKFLGRELIENQAVFEETLESIAPNSTLEDYENLIEPLSIKPASLSNFQQDKVFAYMQVAGPNPVMLKQIEKIDSRLPITNEQYQNIVSQDSLEAALQEGRLYLADYSKLGNLSPGNFGGIQKYISAPVALFAVPPDGYPDKNLLPIAIRCQQAPGDDNPIFTPLNGENWMTAKTVLQMADSNYHELISHLAQTHLFIEPFVLATNRCFTDTNHPVKLLLKPHLEGTILINYGAHNRLLASEGPIDSLLGATIKSNCQLAIKEAQSHLANFNEVAFPRTLEKRGVNNSKQLPIYPYRDDGQQIWDAIYQWVGEYLRLFYRSDNSVETDQQLQNWAGELLSKGHCHIGEECDGRIKTLDYLVEAISTIIFTASAQHAAVNFPQSSLMTYAPAFPLGCYSPAPTKPQQQQNFMGLLPPLERAELQIQVLYLLGSVYYTKLGDYSGSSFQNTQVKKALDNFKDKLTKIEQTVFNEDSQRLVSYRYLLPSKIPQSINI